MRRRGGELDTDAYEDGGGLSSIWGNSQAEQSETSFSSAVRRNDTTPSKRRRGSDAVARRERNDHDPSRGDGSGSHSRSRTVDDEVGAGGHWLSKRSASQHPLRPSASLASSSSWTLDHDTRPTMRRMMSDSSVHREDETEERNGRRDESLGRDHEMLVIVHEVSTGHCYCAGIHALGRDTSRIYCLEVDLCPVLLSTSSLKTRFSLT